MFTWIIRYDSYIQYSDLCITKYENNTIRSHATRPVLVVIQHACRGCYVTHIRKESVSLFLTIQSHRHMQTNTPTFDVVLRRNFLRWIVYVLHHFTPQLSICCRYSTCPRLEQFLTFDNYDCMCITRINRSTGVFYFTPYFALECIVISDIWSNVCVLCVSVHKEQ